MLVRKHTYFKAVTDDFAQFLSKKVVPICCPTSSDRECFSHLLTPYETIFFIFDNMKIVRWSLSDLVLFIYFYFNHQVRLIIFYFFR